MKLFLALLAVLAFPAQAQSPGPEELVRRVTQDVIETIKGDAQLAAGDREKVLRLAEEKVLPHVDFAEAARLLTTP